MATSIPGMPGGRGNSSGINSSTMNPSQGFPGYGIPGMPGGGGGGSTGWGNLFGTHGSTGNPLANPNANAFYGDSIPYSPDINKNLFHAFDDAYGRDMGSVLGDYLSKGAGFNQAAINNLFAAMNPTIARSLATLDAGSGVSGTRFGSAHDFGTADYLNQVYLSQGQLETGMYEQAQQRIFELLGNTGNIEAQTSKGPSWMDSLFGHGILGSQGLNIFNSDGTGAADAGKAPNTSGISWGGGGGGGSSSGGGGGPMSSTSGSSPFGGGNSQMTDMIAQALLTL